VYPLTRSTSRSRFFGLPFSPSVLFAAGEQGVWYDPSDFSTLFTDVAGTTPVTAVEQPVRLMLDKSKGLVLGPELVTNGDFSNGTTGWTATNATMTVVGGQLEVTATGSSNIYAGQLINTTSGKFYRITATLRAPSTNTTLNAARTYIYTDSGLSTPVLINVIVATSEDSDIAFDVIFKAVASTSFIQLGVGSNSAWGAIGDKAYFDNISVRELPGNHALAPSDLARPVLRARYNLLLNTTTLATQSVTVVAAAHTLRFTGTGSITLSGTASGTYSAGSHSITPTAGSLTLTVSGTVTDADLRVTNDALNQPAYQRVGAASDYDTNGFLPYLAFDGNDDSMSTSAIDFSGTDKMTVFAGVRKLSDANVAILTELSADQNTNAGSFYMTAPDSTGASGDFAFKSRGGSNYVGAAISAVILAPSTRVVTGVGDIPGDLDTIRTNGTAVSISAEHGIGNFGNYPLFIGARNNASLFFNGRIYSLTVVGRAVNSGELAAMEAYVNQKTAAY